MTKAQIIDLFRQSLSGNRPTNDDMIRLAEAKLDAYLSLAYQSMVFRITQLNPTDYLSMLGDYTYTLTGVEALERDGQKVLIPDLVPMAIAGQEGVRAVYPTLQPEAALTYRNTNADTMMFELENAMGSTNLYGTYSVFADYILLKPKQDCKKYDIRMVPEFFSLDSDAVVRLPMGGEVALMEAAKAMYQSQFRKDIANDSV